MITVKSCRLDSIEWVAASTKLMNSVRFRRVPPARTRIKIEIASAKQSTNGKATVSHRGDHTARGWPKAISINGVNIKPPKVSPTHQVTQFN